MSLNADDLAQILATLARPAHLSCTRRDGALHVESSDEELVLRTSAIEAVGIRDITQVFGAAGFVGWAGFGRAGFGRASGA